MNFAVKRQFPPLISLSLPFSRRNLALVNGGQNGPPIENAPTTQYNIMIDLNRSHNLARLLPALIICLGLILAGRVTAQTFTTLHSFTALDQTYYTNGDGRYPSCTLVLSGNVLYGTTYGGGSSGGGTVFKINTNGTGFTNLHSFTGSDGNVPTELILSGNTLYGTAEYGGSSGNAGTVFALNTDGTGFTNLYTFTAGSSSWPNITNSDGAGPSGVALSGNTLYGAADLGGSSGIGTLFALNTDGTGFTKLHDFTGSSDGVNPAAGLILSGSTLYGEAFNGGSSGGGTVFAVNTDGTGFTKLHNFLNSGSGGAHPIGGLILSGNTLFGTASGGYNSGGDFSGNGTVFSITLPSPPQLRIIRSAGNVILSWPTNAAGLTFTLQSTTNLVSPAVWTTVSPSSVVVNGQNTVTNPISGTQQFYRLSQ